MPRANVYIRNVNKVKWDSIADKSHWLNTILGNADDTSEWGSTRPSPVGPLTTVLTESFPTVRGTLETPPNGEVVNIPNLPKELCTGHTMRMNCGLKGCKYT